MSYDPIESASKGAAKGVLDWTSDFVKNLVNKLKDRKLAFIQEKKTIERVKQQYHSGELKIYKEYISDKKILFLIQIGLTLRKLEKENELDRRQNLRRKILDHYSVKELHVAQFVENTLLNRYIGILIDDITSIDKFKKDIMTVLENIEKHVIFVKSSDYERGIIVSSTSIIASHSPSIFIVSGISKAAKIVKKCEDRLVKLLSDYELEKISGGEKENLFFKRILKDENK